MSNSFSPEISGSRSRADLDFLTGAVMRRFPGGNYPEPDFASELTRKMAAFFGRIAGEQTRIEAVGAVLRGLSNFQNELMSLGVVEPEGHLE